jgi:phage protein, HK97 gp10 family
MEFRGVAQLQKALQNNIGLDAVKRIVKQNGAEMQQKMQRNVNFTKGYQTGTTRISISNELSDGGLTFMVKPNMEYSQYLEHGTRFMEAQPFVGPAFNAQKSQFKRDLDKLVK